MYLKALNMLPFGNRYDGHNERGGGDSREEEECSVITLLSTWAKQGSGLRFTDDRERGRFTFWSQTDPILVQQRQV